LSIAWDLWHRQVPANGAAVHAQFACDALNAVAGRPPRAHVVPACTPTTPPYHQLLLCLTRCGGLRRWSWSILNPVRLLNEDVLDAPSTASQDLVHGLARIRGEVKPISDLNGIGRALLTSFGVRTGAIAHDALDARMLA
jgi:hypothetical protein